mmetsp:Transcript_1238/g.2168  ORF Transcript_1238/g.2168 Transcript_1238/m.2168 type:complete len:245 (+) Transcript_1238:97-831(+)
MCPDLLVSLDLMLYSVQSYCPNIPSSVHTESSNHFISFQSYFTNTRGSVNKVILFCNSFVVPFAHFGSFELGLHAPAPRLGCNAAAGEGRRQGLGEGGLQLGLHFRTHMPAGGTFFVLQEEHGGVIWAVSEAVLPLVLGAVAVAVVLFGDEKGGAGVEGGPLQAPPGGGLGPPGHHHAEGQGAGRGGGEQALHVRVHGVHQLGHEGGVGLEGALLGAEGEEAALAPEDGVRITKCAAEVTEAAV